MARPGVAVTGYKEFLKACAQGEPSTRKFVREAFRDVGEVVRADAAARFQSIDSKTAAGYRVRVRQRGVAVAQSLKKVDGKHGQYGGLQMAKALRPAVRENEAGDRPAHGQGARPDRRPVRKHTPEPALMASQIVISVKPWDGSYDLVLPLRVHPT